MVLAARNRMNLFVLCLAFLIVRPALGIENRILHPTDLWGQDSAQHKAEQGLVKTLIKAAGQTKPPMYAPSLLVTSSDPQVAVLIGALGGDGEHSYEYSWVFMLGKPEPVLLAKQVPFYISNVWWTVPGKELRFTGEYLVSWCERCDGPELAGPEDMVSIPVAGTISAGQASAQLSAGPYARDSLLNRLKALEKDKPPQHDELKERIRKARELLDASKKIF
jgi:hypothetical protein